VSGAAGSVRFVHLHFVGQVLVLGQFIARSWAPSARRPARDDVIDPLVKVHYGRLVKLTGDGFLAELPSVQDAVRCALAMRDELAASPLAT